MQEKIIDTSYIEGTEDVYNYKVFSSFAVHVFHYDVLDCYTDYKKNI